MRFFRMVLAMLVFAAVGTQYLAGAAGPHFNPTNFWSFFTIVSNVFGACVLLALALDVPRSAHQRDVLRGAATLSLVTVGLVFSILLANVESETIPWVNVVVHFIVPTAIAADWCIDPPRTGLRVRDATLWLIVPIVYVAYTLVRGAIVHWYPYPFLNVDVIGYPAVAGYVLAIAGATALIATCLRAVGNALGARKQRSNA